MLIATHNPGKVSEFRELFRDLAGEIVSLDDLAITAEAEETGATFAENALQKARFYARLSGLPTLADDSGLEVDALGGRPGVLSARYAGPHATDRDRYERVLQELASVPAAGRTARFRCAVALVWPDGRTALATGACEGEIALAPAGAGGFGYDPIFGVARYGQTMAEIAPEIKNVISHRGRAARMMVGVLETKLGGLDN